MFDKLDSILPASSLVEMVNAFIRPSLHSCKGHISQEALNLVMFSHNHRRYKSGKRKGKAPIELLTGEALEADWVELLRQQVNREQEVPLSDSSPSSVPLLLRPNRHEDTNPSAVLADPVSLDTAASETLWPQPGVEAA